MKTLEDIRNEVINIIGEKAEKFGFSRIAGQLEGLLYLSSTPMSLDEMADRLEVSKASISTNIRLLENWKVVKKVYHRGQRKNFYEMKGNIWEIETEIASTIIKDEIERFKSLISHCMKDMKEIKARSKADKEELKFSKEKFADLEEYIEAAEYILNLLLKRGKITPAIVKKIKIT